MQTLGPLKSEMGVGEKRRLKDFDFIDKMGEDVRGERSTRRQILGRK